MISKAYFILGPRYVRFDAAADAVEAGYPKPIAGNWQGFAQVGFQDGVTASVEWPNGKAYFFKGSDYVRYDIAANHIDAGYPLPIGAQWPGRCYTDDGQHDRGDRSRDRRRGSQRATARVVRRAVVRGRSARVPRQQHPGD